VPALVWLVTADFFEGLVLRSAGCGASSISRFRLLGVSPILHLGHIHGPVKGRRMRDRNISRELIGQVLSCVVDTHLLEYQPTCYDKLMVGDQSEICTSRAPRLDSLLQTVAVRTWSGKVSEK